MADLQVAEANYRVRRGLLVSERRVLLACVDGTAVALAFIAAFNLRTAEVRNVGFYVPRFGTAVAVGMWLLFGLAVGAYDLRSVMDIRSGARHVLATLAASLIGLLLVFFFAPFKITRPTLLIWAPLALMAVLAGRYIYDRALSGSTLTQRLVLLASPKALEHTWPSMRQQLRRFYRVVGVIDADRLDSVSRLESSVANHDADQIIVGLDGDVAPVLFHSLLQCHERGLQIRSLADLYEELTGRLLLDGLGPSWLMSLRMRSETSHIYSAFKRAVDIAVSLVGIVALGLITPFFLPFIKRDRGPLFHRQERVGQYGKRITVVKFRTMKVDDSAGHTWAEKGDLRITRFGRILRRLHLDELPQALTILRGDMSLIGPRPEQPHYVEQLASEIDLYKTRLTVRPGLTGWAQVNAGYLSGVEGAREKLAYDLYYIKRQSPSLDLLIIARTAVAVLALRGR